jgi:hypothetical protein
MSWSAWLLIALPVILPMSAGSVESQPDGGSSLAVSQPPIFAVTLLSAKPTYTTVLGNGIATEFDVTNTGTRDVVLMNAQIVAKDQDGKVMFRLEWETKKAVGAGKTVKFTSRHASIAPDALTGVVRMEKKLTIDMDIYKIAYADGEVVTYRDCFMCYF